MWIDNLNMKCQHITERILKCQIQDVNGSFCQNILACYGTPYISEKKDFWEDIKQIVIECNAHWLLVGDLNEVVDDSEKQGGRAVWRKTFVSK